MPPDAVKVTPSPEHRTPTPDLSSALPPEEALDLPLQVPEVAEVLIAIEEGLV
ncbi:MAG: hypothetical protein IIB22_09640 [Chloroflexi bacterium]|nr:hypothetical protein [Chloroflexota bacterium]